MLIKIPHGLRMPALLPTGCGAILGATCIFQFLVSMMIDRCYEKQIGRQFFCIIWYPFAYWIIGLTSTIFGLPKAFFKHRGARAVWESPDRGIR
jgi:biofilm PGA synthesis N-glycosyltransferase PgaC